MRRTLLLAFLLGLSAPALAFEATPSSDRTKAYATIGRNCAAEAQRFCAQPGGGAPLPHNTAICLRPYMSSLSLQCRAALRSTALQPQQ